MCAVPPNPMSSKAGCHGVLIKSMPYLCAAVKTETMSNALSVAFPSEMDRSSDLKLDKAKNDCCRSSKIEMLPSEVLKPD